MSTTTPAPAVAVKNVGATDAVLLPRDQHGDRNDRGGPELRAPVPLVPTTGGGVLTRAETTTV